MTLLSAHDELTWKCPWNRGRTQGHPQYFSAGVAAVCLFTLGACIQHYCDGKLKPVDRFEHQVISLIPNESQSAVVFQDTEASQFYSFAESAGLSLILAAVLPLFLNFPIKRSQSLNKAMLKHVGAFDAIDQMSSHSSDCGIPLAFTLKSGKVYIGYSLTASSLPGKEKSEWVLLFPLLSGYRGKKFKLRIVTNYGDTYNEILEEGSGGTLMQVINQFRVAIALSQVLTIQTFNVDVYYKRFLREHPKASTETEGSGLPETSDAPADVATKITNDNEKELDFDSIMESALRSPSLITDEERVRLKAYRWGCVIFAVAIVFLAFNFSDFLILTILSIILGGMSCSSHLNNRIFLYRL